MSRYHVRPVLTSVLKRGLIASSFLLDHSQYAVAQKKYVFIYDRDGVELHRLKSHIEPTCLEFLPFHWLLATVVRDLHLVYCMVGSPPFSGKSGLFEVPRRLNRAASRRTSYEARSMCYHDSEPT